MKHLRKLSLFICSCLILNCVPMKAQAQEKLEDQKGTELVVDAWIGVTSMAFPEAAPFLEAGKKLLDILGAFDKPDAIGEALKRISLRLDELDARLKNVEQGLNDLQNAFLKEKNWTRFQALEQKRDSLRGYALQLKDKTEKSADFKLELAKDVGALADEFLDPELWNWSDMRQKDGAMAPSDFKPMPTLPLYVTTLATWMTAIAYAGGDNPEFVKRTYGRALQKHIAYLNQTLPENIKTRVVSSIGSIDKYPKNRICTYEVYISDFIRHTSKDAGPGQVTMPSNNDMCQVPEIMGHVPAEGEMQRAYGIDVMEAVAAKLNRLRTQGTVSEQYIGTFDPTKYEQDFLYTVNPNGELLWYRHLVGTGPKAPPPAGDPRKVETQPASPDMRRVGAEANGRVGTVTPSNSRLGAMAGVRDQGAATTGQESGPGRVVGRESQADKTGETIRDLEVTHRLDGPKLIGTGWEQFRDVMPAGKDSIYALTQDGTLKWYRHDNLWDDFGSPKLKGPVDVRSGWQAFVKIVPAGDGILYAITADGTLKWYKHGGYLDGSVSWSGPIDVSPTQRSPLGIRFSRDWANFRQVFSGGEGVMYAITTDGVLQWYHHRGYLTGTPDWEGPRNVGTGWQDFTRVFSTGDGVIYAMKPTGEVLWYKHVGYKDGSVSWQGPVEIAADWKDFIFVFPRMTGTWTPPVIH